MSNLTYSMIYTQSPANPLTGGEILTLTQPINSVNTTVGAKIDDVADYVDTLQAPAIASARVAAQDFATAADVVLKNDLNAAIAANTAAIGAGTTVAALTLTALNAITSKPASSLGYVTNDPTPTNNGIYQWDGTVWTKSTYDPIAQSQAYTDTVVGSKISSKLVSRNLIDATKSEVGKTVNPSGVAITSANFTLTDYIAASPNTAYVKTSTTGAWAEYDVDKVFIQYAANTATIQTSATTAFIRVSILTGATFDVHKSGVLGDADIYTKKPLIVNQYLENAAVKTSITDSSKLDSTIQISAKQLDFLTRVSPNLFDSNRYLATTRLFYATVASVLYAATRTDSSYFTSKLIEVLPSTAYKISGFNSWVQYDINMAVVANNVTPLYVPSEFTTHASAKYFQFTNANSQGSPTTAMFCLTAEYPAAYVSYNRYLMPTGIQQDTAWRDKTILWLGTSIPTLGGYPENVTANLLAKLNKQSTSGGRTRAFKSDGSWFAQSDLGFQFTLAKADVNTRYGGNLGLNVSATDYLALDDGGSVLTQAMLDALTANNYEVRLVPYIATSDLFMIDFGINDRNGQIPNISSTFKTCEELQAAGDLYNRNEFVGGMNFIIKKIIDAKLAANVKNYRIVIVTHHTRCNFQNGSNNVVTAQENVAKFWGLPMMNMADNVGVNDLNIASLTNNGDGLHFSLNSNLEKRYTRYITAKLKDLAT